MESQYLVLSIAGEKYAVDIRSVREVVTYEGVIDVPDSAPWISGVANMRGSIIPIVDLAAKFGLPKQPVVQTTCIVIVELDIVDRFTALGIVSDHVHQVVDLPDNDLDAPRPFGKQVQVDFLRGMGKLGKDIVLVLDVDGILSKDEQTSAAAAIDEVATETEGFSNA